LTTNYNQYHARLSPNGRWMAFTSDESGRPEVYVQRFPVPGPDGKEKISTQGGSEPMWRADGRELFYVAANQTLTSVPISAGYELRNPEKLLDAVIDTSLGNFSSTHYTPTPDGQRFLANVSATNTNPPTIVLNWTAGIKSSK